MWIFFCWTVSLMRIGSGIWFGLRNLVWSALALPTLMTVLPKLRHGAVVLTDNTISGAEGYKDLLAFLRAPENGFQNITLPYTNGFEMSVYRG